MIKQVDNIESFDTIFEPINSPEYNQYCKEVGLAISYIGGKYYHYVEPGGGTMTLVHNPMFDGKKAVPFRLNNNYKDPRDIERDYWKREFEAGNIRLIRLDDEEFNRNNDSRDAEV